MRTLFLVEAGLKAGLGHLMRCRALMLEMQTRGHEIHLWLHGDLSALDGRTWPSGLSVFHSDASKPVNAVFEDVKKLIDSTGYGWLILDGYGLSNSQSYSQFRSHGVKLMILDDFANQDIDADIVLNQNVANMQPYDGRRTRTGRFLLGPQYALLDQAYRFGRTPQRQFGPLRNLLLTFGGVDRYGRTGRVLDLIEAHETPIDIVAVVGPYHPHLAELQALHGRHRVHIVQNVPDLVSLMQTADMAVSAGGTTAWQACCIGLPTMLLQLVDNQRLATEILECAGAALCLDVSAEPNRNAGVPEHEFSRLFAQMTDPAVRAGLSARAMNLVDGLGPARVVDVLESLNITDRQKNEKDTGSLCASQ
jgi:UDP-2,4-diacetamido-2,4,6-trideoxy-beta-L-altropyranose hydrolase